MMPHTRWVAANTLLRAGQHGAAMAQFRQLLTIAPSYAPATFHLCLGSLGDPQLILEKVVPPGKRSNSQAGLPEHPESERDGRCGRTCK